VKEELACSLQELCIKKKKTLALAESCTGGYLAHLITRHPGASKYFLGSFVAYTSELKYLLHVQEKTVKKYGVVSQQVVQEMLHGVFSLCSADFGAAISGVAGPEGGDAINPVGTIWLAWGGRGQVPQTAKLQLHGARLEIIELASEELIRELLEYIHQSSFH